MRGRYGALRMSGTTLAATLLLPVVALLILALPVASRPAQAQVSFIVSIDDVTVTEGDDAGTTQAIFTVSLSRTWDPFPPNVTVDFQTVNGTAMAGADYVAASDTLTFAPGTLSQQVSVNIIGDTSVEIDETFTVVLSNPAGGATIADAEGVGTILDDDEPPPDTAPPDTSITAQPANPTNSTTATFHFTGTDNVTAPAALSFECRLDSAAFAACTSPQSYPGLAAGTHAFQVRAKDAAGNVDPTPASYTWTVATSPRPEVTSIDPTKGPVAGDTTVTITGQNLIPAGGSNGGPGDGGDGDDGGLLGGVGSDPILGDPAASTIVHFGEAEASGVNCNTDGTVCTATSPPGPPGGGPVSVRVTVDGQQSEDTDADNFTYVLPPVANDDTATTPGNTGVTIDVLANDSGEGIETTDVTQPANGTATIGSGGAITYTPNAGFSDTDSFTYTITDDAGRSDTANVTVTVQPALVSLALGPPTVDGRPAASPPGPSVPAGDTITIAIPVTNGGAVNVTNLAGTTGVGNLTCQAPTLAPGASTACAVTSTAAAGAQQVAITVTALGPGTQTVSQTTTAHYAGALPAPAPPPPPQPMTLSVQVWRQIPPLVSENQIEGTIIPVVGGVVEALVGGVVCGQGVTDSQGRTQLIVAADPPAPGCGRPGLALTFRVNGQTAASDPLTFRSGGQAAVTLRLPGPMPPPRR